MEALGDSQPDLVINILRLPCGYIIEVLDGSSQRGRLVVAEHLTEAVAGLPTISASHFADDGCSL